MASAPETKLPEMDSPDAGSSFLEEFYSPVNLIITAIIFVLMYKIYAKFTKVPTETPAVELPKIRKDMTVAELRQYDGTQADGRVLVAVNGWIFDVTRGRRFYGPGGPYAAFGGKDASRGLATFSVTSSDKEYDDLSDLNSMEMESVKEWEAQFRGYHPYLVAIPPIRTKRFQTSFIMCTAKGREWNSLPASVFPNAYNPNLFNVRVNRLLLEKYDLVGRLLKPGEEPINYSDEEPEETDTSTPTPNEEKKEK